MGIGNRWVAKPQQWDGGTAQGTEMQEAQKGAERAAETRYCENRTMYSISKHNQQKEIDIQDRRLHFLVKSKLRRVRQALFRDDGG